MVEFTLSVRVTIEQLLRIAQTLIQLLIVLLLT